MQRDGIGIYVHVPYCRVLCPYCDFVKRRAGSGVPGAFADALCTEIRDFEGPDRARSIFFGGGTPSLLESAALTRIMDALRARFTFDSPEISFETNPDDVSDERLAAWSEAGVNRISLGVQSFDDESLRYLGRCHDARTAHRACASVAAHFENWGLDLIFGAFADRDWERGRASFNADLDRTLEYAPAHVSAYGLTPEEGTPYWERRAEAPDADRSLELYRTAERRLDAYTHYEVSNFARTGYASVHNSIYWHNGAYAGFGPGSVSYIGGVRSRNARSIRGYLDAPGAKSERLVLSESEVRVETLIQGFRLRTGVSKAAYRARFGRDVRDDFGDALDGLMDRGLVDETARAYCPTARGFELNNEIGLALVE